MLIKVFGKRRDTSKLTPEQRIYSLAEKNYKETGDKRTDKETKEVIENALKEVKEI